VEFVFPVIDGHLSFDGFVELNFCSCETEALRLRRELEAASIPLHDVVVADRTLVMKAEDAVQILGATELRRFLAAGELFFHRPVIVVANEDAVTIAVEAERNAAAAQQAAEQAEIAASVFGGKEFGDGNFAGRVVEEAQQGQLRAALFQPAVQTAIHEQRLALARPAKPALAMGGSAAFARGADPGRTQQTAEGLAAERKAFDLTELFAKVMVVETGIGGASQLQDAIPHALGQAAVAGPPAADVRQSRLPSLPIARLESFYMSRR
jgi:hypothetical protein